MISKVPSARRTISWLVKPWRCSELATRRPFRIVERQGPKARLRRGAAQQHVAAAVERPPGIVGAGEERDAVARADRQFAAARDHGARIRIDAGGAVLRPRGPGADRDAAKAVPRVSASQVAPRPTTAATAKANSVPRSRRTVDPIVRCS